MISTNKLKLEMRIAAQGLAWKAVATEDGGTQSQIAIPGVDIKWAQWLRVARNFQLRVGLSKDAKSKSKSGSDERRRETFDGFVREDYDKISNLLKQHYDITLETKDVIFKGWNWGATDFQGKCQCHL